LKARDFRRAIIVNIHDSFSRKQRSTSWTTDHLGNMVADSVAETAGEFMQFVGKKGIALFVAVVVGACGVGFGSGLFLGRQFPANHFERFGSSRFLLNPSTGKICDPFKNLHTSTNAIDEALENPSGEKDRNGFPIAKNPTASASDPFAAYGGHEIKPAQPDYPPSCEK
jgi:hypothetical protein